MGKKQVLLYLFIGVFSSFVEVDAYIFGIYPWKNSNGQVVCGVADYHDYSIKYRDTNAKQRCIVREIVKSFKDDVTVLVEDYSAYSGNDHKISSYLSRLQQISPQSGLYNYCKKCAVDVVNLECRFASFVAYLQAIEPKSKVKPVLACEVAEEFEKNAAEIMTYDDGNFLNGYYKKQVDLLYSLNKDVIKSMKTYKGGLRKFAECNFKPYPAEYFLCNIFGWDSRFLDIRAIHAIVNQKNKKKVCLFAGYRHVYMVVKMLEKLGYIFFNGGCGKKYVLEPYKKPFLNPRYSKQNVWNHGNPSPVNSEKLFVLNNGDVEMDSSKYGCIIL